MEKKQTKTTAKATKKAAPKKTAKAVKKQAKKLPEAAVQAETAADAPPTTQPPTEGYTEPGTEGQDRESYTDSQDRESYTVDQEPEASVSSLAGYHVEEPLTGISLTNHQKPEAAPEPVLVTLPFKELVAALKIAVDIPTRTNIMPILRNVKIEVAGDKATIQATDLQMSWSGVVPAEGGPIVSCVPVHVLLKEIQALPAGTEKVELLFRGSTSTYTASVSVNGRCEINTADPEEYPEIQIAPAEWPECRNLLDGLKRIMPAVSKDETRYVLTGAYFDFANSKLVGTDGFRMHVEDIEPGDTSMKPAIVPLDSCRLISRHCTVDAVGWQDERHIGCPMGCGVFSTKVIEGTYPDWKNVMPKNNEYVVTFSRDEFLGLFNGASIIDGVFNFAVNGELIIQSEGSDGKYNWHIPCGAVMEKESMEFNFNGRFLVDAIRAYPLETVVLKAPDGYGACLLNEKAVVMPIRV